MRLILQALNPPIARTQAGAKTGSRWNHAQTPKHRALPFKRMSDLAMVKGSAGGSHMLGKVDLLHII